MADRARERTTRAREIRGVIVTIDGPAGTGKSSVAHKLARRLGLDFLDTGAMYRAAALAAIEGGLDPADGPAIAGALRRVELRFDWTCDPPEILLGGRRVAERIREPDVGAIVSLVAAQRSVRQLLVEQQRAIARAHPRLVTEGRDQGSIVFPDAPLRFYLDADVHVRASRRAAQLAAVRPDVDEALVLSDISERDRLDSNRSEGPLLRPEGAIVIDTSAHTLDEVVTRLERIARERLPDAGFEREAR
jgi:cytidylate kinase